MSGASELRRHAVAVADIRGSAEAVLACVDALAETLLLGPGLLVSGGLRDEDGHTGLFHHVREQLIFSEHCGVALGASGLVREKSLVYGGNAVG